MNPPRLLRPSAPLWVRLGVPISLIVALAIGLISFLNYYNYEKTYKQLNVSRIVVVARDLRQAIETGLNVGLAPRNNTQPGNDLAIARDHTEGLRFAVVIDESANRLVEVGETAAEQDWARRLAGIGDEAYWLGEGPRTYQIGMPYRNSFGVTVGAIVLGYDKTSIDRAAAEMLLTLLDDWFKAVALMSLLALFGVWWITRRLESELSEADAAIDKALTKGAAPELSLPLLGEQIERGIPAFAEKSRAAVAALAANSGSHVR